MNRFGNIFTLTSFGESHGPALGGVIDGVPSGFVIDTERIQQEADRRRPGSTRLGTGRREPDRVELLSGIHERVTLGSPIGFIIRNTDHHPADYTEMQRLYRPSHADYTYEAKYGLRDWRGGGRSSARETTSRIVAGAVARQILEAASDIRIYAYTSAIGRATLPEGTEPNYTYIYKSSVRCPVSGAAEQSMISEIEEARRQGDSVGGAVSCIISGVPAGLGEPLAGKLQAMLGAAILSIPAVKGWEYGMGMHAARARGSEVADLFEPETTPLRTLTNHSGGIQGGISNGADIYFRVAFKPAPTMMRDLPAVDRDGHAATLHGKGRHDPCVVPRAVSVVEAMTCMTMLDALLLHRAGQLRELR